MLIIKTMVAKRRYFYWILQIYICCVKSVQSKHFVFWSVVCFCEKLHISADSSKYIRQTKTFSYLKHTSYFSLNLSSLFERNLRRSKTKILCQSAKINKTQHSRIQSVTGLYRTRKPLCARRSKRDTISVYNLTESIRSFFQQW